MPRRRSGSIRFSPDWLPKTPFLIAALTFPTAINSDYGFRYMTLAALVDIVPTR